MSEPEPVIASRTHRALRAVCAFLEKHQIDYAVVGGLAVAIWGEMRVTYDVDIVVAQAADQIQAFRSLIQQEPAFLLEPELLTFPPDTTVLRAHVLDRRREEPDLIVVDFISFEKSLTQLILQRRLQVESPAGPVWICSPEDLVILKLISGRVKDLLDVKGVMAKQKEYIDSQYLQDWILRLGCQESWNKLESL